MPSRQKNWLMQSRAIRLAVIKRGTTRGLLQENSAKTGLRLPAGSIQVALSLAARTTVLSFPYRSVAKFLRKNNTVSLSHLWDKALHCQKDAFVLQV